LALPKSVESDNLGLNKAVIPGCRFSRTFNEESYRQDYQLEEEIKRTDRVAELLALASRY
jgi:hypothetical protein